MRKQSKLNMIANKNTFDRANNMQGATTKTKKARQDKLTTNENKENKKMHYEIKVRTDATESDLETFCSARR